MTVSQGQRDSARAYKAHQGKAVRCTSCGCTFKLGQPHQQTILREDGMDACARCVGCNNIDIDYSYDGTVLAKTCKLPRCPGA